MRVSFALFFSLMAAVLPRVGTAEVASLNIFAAASLRGALEDIAEDFATSLSISYAGSGTIARQISAGAPADVVILASPAWMAWLVENSNLPESAVQNVARNALVLIAAPGTLETITEQSLSEFLGVGRLAMGQRDAVPAGSYARQWLMSVGVWESVSTRLAETDNVRAALALVARGQAPLGIVYASDALADPSVKPVYLIPSDSHDPIRYPAAALTAQGQAFLDHLLTPRAAALFESHGFRGFHP